MRLNFLRPLTAARQPSCCPTVVTDGAAGQRTRTLDWRSCCTLHLANTVFARPDLVAVCCRLFRSHHLEAPKHLSVPLRPQVRHQPVVCTILRTMPRSPSSARSPRSPSRSRSPRSHSPIGPDTVRVTKLTKNVTTLHLEEIFDVYGRILDIDLPIVQRLGTHKGTAWITFASPAAAAKAADYMDGGQIDGSIVTVVLDEASPPPRGGGTKRASVSPYRRGGGARGRSLSPRRGRTPSRSPVRARALDAKGRGGIRGRSRSPTRSRCVGRLSCSATLTSTC